MKLICGDSAHQLKYLEDNSIDTIITDPPYGLSFMGKKWDYDVPSVELWRECLRVLKPGGTALIFAGSRTQHRMAVNVEDAGFILKDCIMWLYGSGFPKATDISKQLDKGNVGEVIGEKRFGKTSTGQASGWNANAVAATGKQEVRALVSEEAKLWNGWKSHGLKPAYEPILVAMKTNDGTYANNALEWGVSGLNIDGGRIPTDEVITNHSRGADSAVSKGKYGDSSAQVTHQTKGQAQGRFPANVILDEEAGKMLDAQSGELKSGGGNKANKKPKDRLSQVPSTINGGSWNIDKGGASRFFYCAKASKSERNAGCEGLEEKQTTGGGGGIGDYKDDVNSCSGKYGSEKSPGHNYHPTVKPLKLMEYLCTLTKTPTGGIVLDPFMGSGTTGVACINTERDFIGIEREQEYIDIATARIEDAANEEPKQQNLF